MSCYSRFTQNVQACGGVRATKGIEPRIFVAPHGSLQYDDTTENKLTNPLFSTVVNNWVEVEGYKNTFNCGSDEVVSEIVGSGFKHYISFMYNGTNAEIDKVDNITVVVIRGGILEVYGLKNGLWKSSQSKKANDNNGLSMVEFTSLEGREEDYSCYLFDNGVDNLALLSTQLGITGLILPISTNATFTYAPNTASVKLILSDGTIFTGVSGTVTFSTAIEQGATIVADETTTEIDLTALGISGNLNTPFNLPTLILNDNALTTAMCDYILDRLIANGQVVGTHVLSLENSLSAPTLAKVNEAEALGWTIPF